MVPQRGGASSDCAGSGESAVSQVRFLAVLPFVGILGGALFLNRVTPFVLGMPFLLFWLVLWIVLTSLIMFVIYRSDPRNRGEG